MGHPEPENFDDYYELLGVDRTADRTEVVTAYRQLVARYHPDVAERMADRPPNEEATAQLFTHLTRAREILSTEARRDEYDRLGHERYLLEHLDGTTLTPAEEARSSDRATDRGTGSDRGAGRRSGATAGPGWYRAASAVGPVAQPVPGAGPTGRGLVVEGDPETTIADLVDGDPLETAWVWFRRCWVLRGFAAAFCPVAALLAGVAPLLVTAVGAVGTVAITGGYAVLALPRATEPATPPPSASVGLLRPTSAVRLWRWGFGTVSLGALLALAGGVREPSPATALQSAVGPDPLGTPWVPAGLLGAPKLVDPINITLLAAFVLATVVGTAAAVLGLSAGTWLAVHGGHRSVRPVTRDSLATLGAVCVTGFTVPELTGPASAALTESLPPAAASMLGITDGAPTGVTLGLLGMGLLLVLLVRYEPESTSATIS